MLAVVAIVVVIAAAAIVFCMLNPDANQVQPGVSQDPQGDSAIQVVSEENTQYLLVSNTTYHGGDVFQIVDYERAEDGTTEKTSVFSSSTSEWVTTAYKDIGDGVTIPLDAEGSYQKNADGDVVEVMYVREGVTHTSRYEYYRPGIIKESITETSDGKSYRTVYDEKGWPIERYFTGVAYDEKHQSHLEERRGYYSYEFLDGDKTVVLKVYGSEGKTGAPSFAFTLALDEHGNIIRIYDGETASEDDLSNECAYQEVKQEASSYNLALGRLYSMLGFYGDLV